jgi:hypothetical protein
MRSIRFTALLLSLLLLPRAADAQVIMGEVVRAGDRMPIAGAFIRLLDADGVQRGAALADSLGRFTIRPQTPGEYSLRAEMIGHVSTTSDPLQLGTTTLRYTMVVPIRAITLEGLPVAARTRCRVRPESTAETQRLWDEARKVLGLVDWDIARGRTGYEIATFRRQLDRVGRPLRQNRPELGETFDRKPFTTPSAEQLAQHGFIRQTRGEEHTFYAPDAEVLLSDAFLASHCFWVTRSTDPLHRGMIGLAFEPLPSVTLPDISGVLWLDETTAELRLLEYGYTSMPWNLADGLARGRIEFGRTPTGTWIMQRWSIRIPRVQHMQGVRVPNRYMHLGFEEAGGQVRAIRLGGVRIPLEGRAVDAAAPEPIGVPTRVGIVP